MVTAEGQEFGPWMIASRRGRYPIRKAGGNHGNQELNNRRGAVSGSHLGILGDDEGEILGKESENHDVNEENNHRWHVTANENKAKGKATITKHKMNKAQKQPEPTTHINSMKPLNQDETFPLTNQSIIQALLKQNKHRNTLTQKCTQSFT